jgi:hypothetical protein
MGFKVLPSSNIGLSVTSYYEITIKLKLEVNFTYSGPNDTSTGFEGKDWHCIVELSLDSNEAGSEWKGVSYNKDGKTYYPVKTVDISKNGYIPGLYITPNSSNTVEYNPDIHEVYFNDEDSNETSCDYIRTSPLLRKGDEISMTINTNVETENNNKFMLDKTYAFLVDSRPLSSDGNSYIQGDTLDEDETDNVFIFYLDEELPTSDFYMQPNLSVEKILVGSELSFTSGFKNVTGQASEGTLIQDEDGISRRYDLIRIVEVSTDPNKNTLWPGVSFQYEVKNVDPDNVYNYITLTYYPVANVDMSVSEPLDIGKDTGELGEEPLSIDYYGTTEKCYFKVSPPHGVYENRTILKKMDPNKFVLGKTYAAILNATLDSDTDFIGKEVNKNNNIIIWEVVSNIEDEDDNDSDDVSWFDRNGKYVIVVASALVVFSLTTVFSSWRKRKRRGS